MSHSDYELFLRHADDLDDDAMAAVRRTVAEDDALRLEQIRREDRTLGFDLAIGLDERQGAERLTRMALQLAAEHQLTIYDPQQSRAIGVPADVSSVVQTFARQASFAAGAFLAPPAEETGWRSSTKLWLLAGGGFLLLLLLAKALRCAVS